MHNDRMTTPMIRPLLVLIFAFTGVAPRMAHADALAWWRFDDQPAGQKLDAELGGVVAPYTTARDFTGHDNPLRTFNTRTALYPPDTSGTFVADPTIPPVDAEKRNTIAARFVGDEDFYTAKIGKESSPIESAKLDQFTIEGLFKLDALSGAIGNKYQAIIAKDGRPVKGLPFQPFAVSVAGGGDRYMPADCIGARMIDSAGNYRVAASKLPLQAGRWYAFAVTCDGKTLKLYLNRMDGKGYRLEGESQTTGGLIESTGQWTIARGQFADQPTDWLYGSADELRINNQVLPQSKWLTDKTLTAIPATQPQVVAELPQLCVKHLADPAAIFYKGVYYLYGTQYTGGFGVYSSSDLKHWKKGPTLIKAARNVWGDRAFWAPGMIERDGNFYMYYSSSGILPDSGGRRSVRISVATSNSPTGPFKEVAPHIPLLGRAVIDPAPFIDDDGKAYLYFVADIPENNGVGQIYVVRLADDMITPVGEPMPCIQPSQVWEGPKWNEGPFVFRVGKWYIMTYSGNFFGSANYALGVATSLSPMGPWDKRDDNPFMLRYAGMYGTGHNSITPTPDGKGLLIFFHAHRSERDATRDTYVARLLVEHDVRGDVKLKVVPWKGDKSP